MKRLITCCALSAAVLLAAAPLEARERPKGVQQGGSQMSQKSKPQKSSSKKKKSKKSRGGVSLASSPDRPRYYRAVERPSRPAPRRGGITFVLPF